VIRLCEYYFCRRLLLGVMPANIFCAEKEPPKREVLRLKTNEVLEPGNRPIPRNFLYSYSDFSAKAKEQQNEQRVRH